LVSWPFLSSKAIRLPDRTSLLYHGQVALKTSHEAFALLALVPPGNEARQLVLYKRALFAATGEASGLGFPEILPLAWRAGGPGFPGSKEARERALRLLEKRLEEAWKGIEGGFETGGLTEAGGSIFLDTRGPLEALKGGVLSALESSFPGMGWERLPSPSAHFALAADGFFLALGTIPAAPATPTTLASPPRLAFRDADLALYAFEASREPPALLWRERARSRRKGL
jgi:hypothetical protein